MSKHTPGPWSVGNYIFHASAYSEGVRPVHAKKRGLIASAKREADARLIAAAPELLEALETCEAFLLSAGLASSDAYSEVCAAIAKATGEPA